MPKWAPANNQVPSVADLIAYISDQVISQVTSATRPSPGATGEMIFETDTGRYMAQNGAGFIGFGGLTASSFTSYTPQIDQGASVNITKTTAYSTYMRFGNMVCWSFAFSLTAAGTAGSNFTLTTPVTMATTSTGLGWGRIYDSSATTGYTGGWIPSTTTTMRLYVDTNISNSAWGIAPNAPVGSGDGIHGLVWLPIA